VGSGFDNGQERPSGGRDDGLPEIPAEWGPLVIPDDPAELDSESTAIRRELRHLRRQRRRRNLVRRLTRRPMQEGGLHVGPGTTEPPTLALPLLIMAIAVIASLVSLFALSWPSGRPLLPIQTATPGGGARTRPTMPNLVLSDTNGVAVPLADLRSSILVLAEMCACTTLESDLIASVDPRVQIIVITTAQTVAADPRARRLTDPAGQVRATFAGQAGGDTRLSPSAPPSGASLLLVDRSGAVIVHQQVLDASQIKDEATQLTE
jgi:hypothetical protein